MTWIPRHPGAADDASQRSGIELERLALDEFRRLGAMAAGQS
jgi:hypothetical protein